jgi:DNA replication protein DnaC
MISPRKIESEKIIIINRCKSCSGIGCQACYGYCSYIDKMAEAGIPVDYWYRKMEDFYGDVNFKAAVMHYISHLDVEFSNGITYCFTGERGRGKTMAACCILKEALLPSVGYTAYYTTLSDLITNIVGTQRSLLLQLKYYDFVVIDEVDQRFFPTQSSMELFGNQLENVLRGRMQNRLPTILCTNSADTRQIFGGEFKKSFDSLGSQFIRVLAASGRDAREGKEKL